MLNFFHLDLYILLLQTADFLCRVVVFFVFSDVTTQYIIVTLFIP